MSFVASQAPVRFGMISEAKARTTDTGLEMDIRLSKASADDKDLDTYRSLMDLPNRVRLKIPRGTRSLWVRGKFSDALATQTQGRLVMQLLTAFLERENQKTRSDEELVTAANTMQDCLIEMTQRILKNRIGKAGIFNALDALV